MLRALTTALITLAFAGCVADNGGEGFVIVSNESLSGGNTCSVVASSNGPFQSRGEISLYSPSGYVFTPVLQSNITTESMMDMIQRTITLQGANVELTVNALTIGHADGTFTKAMPPTLMGTDGKFLSQFSGSLAPGGLTGIAFEVIPATTLGAIRQAAGTVGAGDTVDAEVTATIKPFGEMGGGRVDGHPFKYPVSVCTNCVVRDLGACPVMNVTNKGNPCNVFQDGVVDCCESAGGLLCPAQ
ncbi:MAG: hypothetical protein JO257_17270 [Deltaproteobacteria bacterium]|nr:hypothetical protein [Deltaproteobacteria bacterium]